MCSIDEKKLIHLQLHESAEVELSEPEDGRNTSLPLLTEMPLVVNIFWATSLAEEDTFQDFSTAGGNSPATC